MLDLNNPDTRQTVLQQRLSSGGTLGAATLAEELGISVHTTRRNLIALEQKGLARRVRGGAVPAPQPTPDYLVLAEENLCDIAPIAARAVALIPKDATVLLDAGTTMDAVARHLPSGFAGLIVTPSPSVALLAPERGAQVHLVGAR